MNCTGSLPNAAGDIACRSDSCTTSLKGASARLDLLSDKDTGKVKPKSQEAKNLTIAK